MADRQPWPKFRTILTPLPPCARQTVHPSAPDQDQTIKALIPSTLVAVYETPSSPSAARAKPEDPASCMIESVGTTLTGVNT